MLWGSQHQMLRWGRSQDQTRGLAWSSQASQQLQDGEGTIAPSVQEMAAVLRGCTVQNEYITLPVRTNPAWLSQEKSQDPVLEYGDSSCCSGHLSWLGAPTQHKMRNSDHSPITCSPFPPSTCYLWSHFRTGTELLKQLLLRAGSFHSSALGDGTSHAAKDTTFLLHFAFEVHLLAPFTLIINSIHGNFSLNHAHNGTGYIWKKKIWKRGAHAFPEVSSMSHPYPYGLVYRLMSESQLHTQTQNKSRNTTFDHPTLMFTLVSCSPRWQICPLYTGSLLCY